MEMKVSSPSSARSSKKRPPSRLQKQAPASLQLEQGAEVGAGAGAMPGPAAWGEGTAPIPLLSPLVMSPAVPVWEADQAGARRPAEGAAVQGGGGQGGGEQKLRAAATRLGGANGERQAPPTPTPSPAAGAGWQHPALPAPLPEPASLVPMFQSQCAVEVRNAQQ